MHRCVRCTRSSLRISLPRNSKHFLNCSASCNPALPSSRRNTEKQAHGISVPIIPFFESTSSQISKEKKPSWAIFCIELLSPPPSPASCHFRQPLTPPPHGRLTRRTLPHNLPSSI